MQPFAVSTTAIGWLHTGCKLNNYANFELQRLSVFWITIARVIGPQEKNWVDSILAFSVCLLCFLVDSRVGYILLWLCCWFPTKVDFLLAVDVLLSRRCESMRATLALSGPVLETPVKLTSVSWDLLGQRCSKTCHHCGAFVSPAIFAFYE